MVSRPILCKLGLGIRLGLVLVFYDRLYSAV